MNNNEVKEKDLIFGDAMLSPNCDENWKFILADRTYTLDAPTEVLVSRIFNQLLQLKANNDKLSQKLEKAKEDLNTIFTTLEKANNSGLINDTIWVTDLMTLWDLIQQALKELE